MCILETSSRVHTALIKLNWSDVNRSLEARDTRLAYHIHTAAPSNARPTQQSNHFMERSGRLLWSLPNDVGWACRVIPDFTSFISSHLISSETSWNGLQDSAPCLVQASLDDKLLQLHLFWLFSESPWMQINYAFSFTLLPPPKKEVMFLVRSVCLFVRLSVGLLANLWTDFDEIVYRGRAWLKDQVIQFWWRSGSRFGSGCPKSEIRILRITRKIVSCRLRRRFVLSERILVGDMSP